MSRISPFCIDSASFISVYSCDMSRFSCRYKMYAHRPSLCFPLGHLQVDDVDVGLGDLENQEDVEDEDVGSEEEEEDEADGRRVSTRCV